MKRDALSQICKTADALWKRFDKSKKLQRLHRAHNTLLQFHHFPFDWRFNSIAYAIDLYSTLREISYVYCMSEAAHKQYVCNVPKGSQPRNVPFLVNLYAGDCLYRILAATDRLMMCYTAYYGYIDVDQKHKNSEIKEILDSAVHHMRRSLLAKSLREYRKLIKGKHWTEIKEFRHMKTHRLDTKFDAYSVERHHDLVYLRRMTAAEARRRAERDYVTGYSKDARKTHGPLYREDHIKSYMRRSQFEGKYYEQVRPENRLAAYPQVKVAIKRCMNDLIKNATHYFEAILKTDLFKQMI